MNLTQSPTAPRAAQDPWTYGPYRMSNRPKGVWTYEPCPVPRVAQDLWTYELTLCPTAPRAAHDLWTLPRINRPKGGSGPMDS
jgi:hypothetical protein